MAYNPENVPFSKPTISIDCLYQVDFKKGAKGEPETDIHKYGCCFMSHLTIVQIMNNKPLSYAEVLEIHSKATQAGWLGESCWVKDPTSIMSLAENILTGGKPKYKYLNIACQGVTATDRTFGMQNLGAQDIPSDSNIYFCVTDFNTKSGPDYGGHHFVLFGGTGILLYDPNKADLGSGYVGVNKIALWKVKKI